MKNIKKIITSISALYELGFISYSPNKEYLELIWGTNSSYYDKNKYDIKVQKINSYTIGVIEKNNKFYYCPERLFIELDKFPLENTIRQEAIQKLEKEINPFIVEKLYLKLKDLRRGLDRTRIESYIARKSSNLQNLLVKYSNDHKSIIREYVMALLSKNDDLVTMITKGGSAIEILSLTKRSTLDIDSHIDKNEVKNILSIIKNKENHIYFEVVNEENINYDKKIIKLILVPKSRSKITTKLLEDQKIDERKIEIPLSLNTTYEREDIQETIQRYHLQKQPLRRMSNYSVLVFSKEMILAEKFKSLIFKPETTTRTKDLIDLFLLWEINIDQDLFIRWFYKKSLSDKNSVDKEETLNIIKNNQNKAFPKLKDNFTQAIQMYDIKTTYEECIDIYKKLIGFFID